jgi:hypothetical protein
MLGIPGISGLGMGIFAESIGHTACRHHDGFWGATVLHCPGTRVTIAITVNQATSTAIGPRLHFARRASGNRETVASTVSDAPTAAGAG